MKCILVALIISASGVVCASKPTGTQQSRTKKQTERYKKGPTKKQIKEGQAIKAFVKAKYGAKKK